jgi:hypothetical protein
MARTEVTSKKAERLRVALRDNLKRRKAQAKARSNVASEPTERSNEDPVNDHTGSDD